MSARRFRVLLTGASGGLGSAIAGALAPHCDALLLVGRNAKRLRELEVTLNSPCSRSVQADIGTTAGREAVFTAARDVDGGIDVLINNAGTGAFSWLADQDDEALGRIIAANVVAPMQLTRKLLPLLQDQPSAAIINVGSIFGYIGYPGCAAYSASKFGLRGFTEALRRELADTTVRVMYFAPRSTRTPFNSDAMYALNDRLGVAVDEPELVAQALLRLLRAPGRERLLGFPERLFARINQVMPALVDAALRRQLPIIRAHAREHDMPSSAPRRGA
jgi:short-subunit dehydrogenase